MFDCFDLEGEECLIACCYKIDYAYTCCHFCVNSSCKYSGKQCPNHKEVEKDDAKP